MNLNREIGAKKEVYPSKKSINLCYQEEVSTTVSTMALWIVFGLVVLLLLTKILVIDLLTERNEALAKLEKVQTALDRQLEILEDYDEVAEEYARYSYKLLVDALPEQDRLEILATLEETVFKDGGMSNVSITGNVIKLSFKGLNLDECAQLIADLYGYEMVQDVLISNQTGSADGTYMGNVTITLKTKVAGGEQ
jgi:hypothetical protein